MRIIITLSLVSAYQVLAMVVYPPQPTSEEKALRKRYARLQELTKEVRLSVKKSLPPSAGKSSSLGSSSTQAQPIKKETVSPKDAKEAARRLLQAGKLTIQNKANAKTSGFKRVGDGASRGIVQPPPAKKPHIVPSTSKAPLGKPKPKILAADQNALYSRFVKASDQITTRKIPKKADIDEDTVEEQSQDRLAFSTKECTVFVKWSDSVLGEDELRTAFVRFGQIRDFRLHHRNKAFITFENPSISRHVRNEMNRGMIRGVEMRVDMASEENGFVELPEEAADQPWAKIAAGLPPTDSPSKAISSSRSIRSYATDF